MILGLDVGSVSCKAVLLNEASHLVKEAEVRCLGKQAEAVRKVVSLVLPGEKHDTIRVGVTGCGRQALDWPSECVHFNDIISLAGGAIRTYPESRSVIEIGGQASRWLLLSSRGAECDEPEILDFALNERCAAGSGAFIEQQASRLKMSIKEFSEVAVAAGKGATVAGRCSVFAKTDMIHLQQKGTPVGEIAYGLCLAMARNFVASILRGRICEAPVLLTGGAIRNLGLVRAFREILSIETESLKVASNPSFTCAWGAAVNASHTGKLIPVHWFMNSIISIKSGEVKSKTTLSPLEGIRIIHRDEPSPDEQGMITGYLGVDVGSVSTNLALVDADGTVKAGVYLPTRGRPLEVIREGYDLLLEKCKGKIEISGIGTTGSGRYLAGRYLHADAVRNEITCQLISATHYFPEVDTVFEIGGQDSKFINVKNGQIFDFTMNKICAAGTGSFLEEQAEHLGIDIVSEFSSRASQSKSPRDLGSRCTVFMDTELVNAISSGNSVPDICAGLAYSIVRNYLEKVVEDRSVGNSVVFQGGVASNPAVVNAFSLWLGKEILVHPHNRISGAIGAALVAKKTVEEKGKVSPDITSLGERINQSYSVSSFQCQQCHNLCQVNRISLENEDIYFGDTCERYTSNQASAGVGDTSRVALDSDKKLFDLFKRRNELLLRAIKNPVSPSAVVGLPLASFMVEYLPFWATFFNQLGFGVCLSPPSNSEMFEDGLQSLSAETCLPVKLAFGHIRWLQRESVDWIFFPSLVSLNKESQEAVHLCPYTEHIPFMVKSRKIINLCTPCVDIHSNAKNFLEGMTEIGRIMRKKPEELTESFALAVRAQKDFQETRKSYGLDVLQQHQGEDVPTWIVLGKPYNVHDAFLNLNLSKHLQRLRVRAIPMDFAPCDEKDFQEWPGMPPWHYNREMIRVALWSNTKKNVYPLIVSNFGCGPDAFVMKHIGKILADKPHLLLEFDEHRAEAGLITRLEAFYDEVKDYRDQRQRSSVTVNKPREKSDLEDFKKRKFIIPYFADHAIAFSGAFRRLGIEAKVLPLPDEQTLSLGEQHSSGRECHAYAMIAGDLVKYAQSQREGNEVYFFPGSKYECLLAQYGEGMNYILSDIGVNDMEVLAPSQEYLVRLMGMKGARLLWRGLVAVDLLVKVACERRPYERLKGQTDEVHSANLRDIEEGMANGDFHAILNRCVQRLQDVRIDREERPLIGIAGDIYTRHHPVANHDLFLKLEELGCEVWPSPFLVDQINFGLWKSFYKSIKEHKLHASFLLGLLNMKKEFETWKVRRDLQETMPRYDEPSFRKVLENSSSYMGLENNNMLFLNVSKMVDFAQRGADGVINAICFNCMLGTIAGAISTRIREDFDNIPIPTLVYSGTGHHSEDTKLEAFVFQVKHYHKRNKAAFPPESSS
ncbi:acyl-CoA dehydratase activase [Acidobacteriota bacterium]